MTRTIAALSVCALSFVGIGAAHAQTYLVEESYAPPVYIAPRYPAVIAPPAYAYVEAPTIVAPPAYVAPAPVYAAPPAFVVPPRRADRIVVRERIAPMYEAGFVEAVEW